MEHWENTQRTDREHREQSENTEKRENKENRERIQWTWGEHAEDRQREHIQYRDIRQEETEKTRK